MDGNGNTPVAFAFLYAPNQPPPPDLIVVLRTLVTKCPEATRAADQALNVTRTALFSACEKFPDLGLIEAVIQAFPNALVCSADQRPEDFREQYIRLPFEAARAQQGWDPAIVELVEQETENMALAIFEYVLPSKFHDPTLLQFQRLVSDTIPQHYPPAALGELNLYEPSSVEFAHSLRTLGVPMQLVADVFHHDVTRQIVCKALPEREVFRHDDVLMGDTVADLYFMNKNNRFRRSPHHQVRLLASVGHNLDILYLHFRENHGHLLRPQTSRTSDRNRIQRLESENERLLEENEQLRKRARQLEIDGDNRVQHLESENRQLQERIAQLENENEELLANHDT